MVVSGGDEKKVQAAVNHIRYAVLGIVFLVVILFVAPTFLRLIGLGAYSDYVRPQTILHTIQEVSAYIFGGTADSGSANPSLDPMSPSSNDFTTL